MKLYAPEYYKSFKCIADRCTHSCCIGWEIDVDPDTAKKYSSLSHGYGKYITESIEWSDTPHFKLSEGDRCPHLDGRGLCRIITELSEDCLCHICREHPRFYNDTPHGKEVGVGIACEEAARLVLSSDGYAKIEVIGVVEDEENEFFFDPTVLRQRIYSLLSDRSIPYAERLDALSEPFKESLASIEAIKEIIASLEYLDERHRTLFTSHCSFCEAPKELESQLERSLAYFIYRHCTAAWDEEEFLASLGFSLFCERLIRALSVGGLDVIEAARIVSEELEYSEDNTESIKNMFYARD
jgi:lysine-N-methylase